MTHIMVYIAVRHASDKFMLLYMMMRSTVEWKGKFVFSSINPMCLPFLMVTILELTLSSIEL